MFNEAKDVPGECNARLYCADDYGDNSTTFRCTREAAHDGLHRETFEREGGAGTVTIEWEHDERKKCSHNCGQWEREHHDTETCPRYAFDHNLSTCAFCNPGETPTPCSACGALHYGSRHYKCPGAEPTADTVDDDFAI